ncbi:hypothetical protein COU59_03675 [Candidatus Pacearchaeota archaeon CG10_big_fil_rev_8_21_14_0_10_34_12]|nr:MAG: hypothetical protein COU59_03675 [Candidatus Pacearchaeota archaeon CG10_big_fil_rev_8_21_14_0_10_34_12]
MKEEDFKHLLKNLEKNKEQIIQEKEKIKKELEENDLIIDFNEDREEVYVVLWKTVYTFDRGGYKEFEKLWEKGVLQPNKSGYLCVKDDWNDSIPIHRHLKLEEVKRLAKKLQCDIKDIHVHHVDKNKENNIINNLEVLHKDEHAQRHGVNTWEQLIAISMKNK